MRSQWIMIFAGAAALSAFLVQRGPAQQQKGKAKQAARTTAVAPGDWPLYSRDPASTRFSPLTQINTQNVAGLTQAWTYSMAPETPPVDAAKARAKGAGGFSSEATPVVVNGVMYLPVGDRIAAIEADSGKELWRYRLPGGRGASGRGVGYWPGDASTPPHVIFLAGQKLSAINANTGRLDPGFGKEGTIEVPLNWNGVPYIYKNMVLMGGDNGESTDGPPGDTRAFSARDGQKMWEFHTIAQPGDPGHETWLDDGWKKRAGVNTWGWYFTADEANDTFYMPLGSPAGNYWGGDRPGANLYGNSLVAVDANTGKYKWHFQVVHHDLWDSDLPPAPGLVDIVKDGQRIPALALIGKTAQMFILDRTSGKPVFGVEERPVPKGDVPGEWYSPTQPFPVKPPALARTSFKKEDLVTADDTSPEHAKACQELWEKAGGYRNEGPFTPFLFHEAGTPPKSTLQFPGNGGPNWGGTATDPSLGYVFVNTHDAALSGWIEKKVQGADYGTGNGSPQPYDRGSVSGPGPYSGFSAQVKDANGKMIGNWPCQKPPWGRLFAVNANTGDIAWEIRLGLTEGLPPAKQNTGSTGSAGPSATAGGLLFIGSTNDRHFRAFESKTGKLLWEKVLDRAANANPIVYQGKNGKQYVAVVATDQVITFALP